MFDQYVDEDDPGVIGPEGFERLCTDSGISMDSTAPLLLAWQLGSTELAKITKNEWMKGMQDLRSVVLTVLLHVLTFCYGRISSLDNLKLALQELEQLLLLETSLATTSKPVTGGKPIENVPYNRSKYVRYAQDTTKAFRELYLFSFMLVKSESVDKYTMSDHFY